MAIPSSTLTRQLLEGTYRQYHQKALKVAMLLTRIIGIHVYMQQSNKCQKKKKIIHKKCLCTTLHMNRNRMIQNNTAQERTFTILHLHRKQTQQHDIEHCIETDIACRHYKIRNTAQKQTSHDIELQNTAQKQTLQCDRKM